MNQDKMHLINKIFNNETIRTVWDKEDEKYYISVVDIKGLYTIFIYIVSIFSFNFKRFLIPSLYFQS